MALTVTKLYCKKCGRYLCNAIGSAKLDNVICASCKFRNRFDIRVPREKSNVTK